MRCEITHKSYREDFVLKTPRSQTYIVHRFWIPHIRMQTKFGFSSSILGEARFHRCLGFLKFLSLGSYCDVKLRLRKHKFSGLKHYTFSCYVTLFISITLFYGTVIIPHNVLGLKHDTFSCCVTLLRFITLFYGIDIIPHNIPIYSLHSVFYSQAIDCQQKRFEKT